MILQCGVYLDYIFHPTREDSIYASRNLIKKIIYFLVFVNIIMALYFSTIHQRGGISVINYIRSMEIRQ
jgi:hypothetical protein